jgi:uncharacterized protein
MSVAKKINFGSANGVTLNSAPINPEWIMEGAPLARNALLSHSEDGTAFTLVWDCTGGVFNWHYDIDETVYVIDGSVGVMDDQGVVARLSAGDTAFFPAGSHAVWRVESYVRKIAFCRRPPHRSYVLAKKMAKSVLRGVGLRKGDEPSSGMFGKVA